MQTGYRGPRVLLLVTPCGAGSGPQSEGGARLQLWRLPSALSEGRGGSGGFKLEADLPLPAGMAGCSGSGNGNGRDDGSGTGRGSSRGDGSGRGMGSGTGSGLTAVLGDGPSALLSYTTSGHQAAAALHDSPVMHVASHSDEHEAEADKQLLLLLCPGNSPEAAVSVRSASQQQASTSKGGEGQVGGQGIRQFRLLRLAVPWPGASEKVLPLQCGPQAWGWRVVAAVEQRCVGCTDPRQGPGEGQAGQQQRRQQHQQHHQQHQQQQQHPVSVVVLDVSHDGATLRQHSMRSTLPDLSAAAVMQRPHAAAWPEPAWDCMAHGMTEDTLRLGPALRAPMQAWAVLGATHAPYPAPAARPWLPPDAQQGAAAAGETGAHRSAPYAAGEAASAAVVLGSSCGRVELLPLVLPPSPVAAPGSDACGGSGCDPPGNSGPASSYHRTSTALGMLPTGVTSSTTSTLACAQAHVPGEVVGITCLSQVHLAPRPGQGDAAGSAYPDGVAGAVAATAPCHCGPALAIVSRQAGSSRDDGDRVGCSRGGGSRGGIDGMPKRARQGRGRGGSRQEGKAAAAAGPCRMTLTLLDPATLACLASVPGVAAVLPWCGAGGSGWGCGAAPAAAVAAVLPAAGAAGTSGTGGLLGQRRGQQEEWRGQQGWGQLEEQEVQGGWEGQQGQKGQYPEPGQALVPAALLVLAGDEELLSSSAGGEEGRAVHAQYRGCRDADDADDMEVDKAGLAQQMDEEAREQGREEGTEEAGKQGREEGSASPQDWGWPGCQAEGASPRLGQDVGEEPADEVVAVGEDGAQGPAQGLHHAVVLDLMGVEQSERQAEGGAGVLEADVRQPGGGGKLALLAAEVSAWARRR